MRAWPNTQNHCKVLRSRTRKSHHLPRIFTTRTPFSPTRMPKRRRGGHFARATERPRAKTTTSRQKAPRAPTPRMPHFSSNNQGNGARKGPRPLPLYTVNDTTPTYPTHIPTQRLTTRAPTGGRRTSPACGSFRRPLLKSGEKQGITKNNDGMKLDGDQLDLFSNTRKNIAPPTRSKTERAKGIFFKQKNTNLRSTHRDQRAEGQNTSFSTIFTRRWKFTSKTRLFHPSQPTPRRGAPAKTHTFARFRRAIGRPPYPPR